MDDGPLAPTRTPDPDASRPLWSVHVLGTTVEGTRCALRSAKQLTEGSDAEIVLLAPRVTSFFSAFDPGSNERAVVIQEHLELADRVGVDATVLFCVCQRLDDVVHQLLGRSSLVVVGGRRGTCWPSREQRLVRRLTGEGYPVVFVQVGAELRAHCVRAPRSKLS